jgi:fatty-acyl-CoA synthase
VLGISNRDSWATLLDSILFRATDLDATVLSMVSSSAEPEVVTLSRLRDEVSANAFAIRDLGVRPGEVVAIVHTQSLDAIFAFWGAILCGAVPAMFPTLTEKLDRQIYLSRLSRLIELTDVALVLTTEGFRQEIAENVSCRVLSVPDTIGQNEEVFEDLVKGYGRVSPDAITFLQHSSGTTGLQKGVALSHKAVLNQIASYSDALRLTPSDVIVSWLPLYHDMGLIAGFLLPMLQGVPLVLMSPFDWVQHPGLLLRAIHENKGTLCWLPNFAYNHMVRRVRERDLDQMNLASVRAFINCSEPVRHDSHEMFLERFAKNGIGPEAFAVSYAMAENVFAVTQTNPGVKAKTDRIDREMLVTVGRAIPVLADTGSENRVTIVSCGRPITGVKLRIIDSQGNEAQERTVGEISIGGESLFTGYYRRSDIQPFGSDGFFCTGDTGYVADGELYVIGRKKDIIIANGKNLYPQDIEAVVNQIDQIIPGRSVAFGVMDEREGTERVVVVAEWIPLDTSNESDIRNEVRRQVASALDVMVGEVSLVPPRWLIKTSSGKIARNANKSKWLTMEAARVDSTSLA